MLQAAKEKALLLVTITGENLESLDQLLSLDHLYPALLNLQNFKLRHLAYCPAL